MFVAIHRQILCELHMLLSFDGTSFTGPRQSLQMDAEALRELKRGSEDSESVCGCVWVFSATFRLQTGYFVVLPHQNTIFTESTIFMNLLFQTFYSPDLSSRFCYC